MGSVLSRGFMGGPRSFCVKKCVKDFLSSVRILGDLGGSGPKRRSVRFFMMRWVLVALRCIRGAGEEELGEEAEDMEEDELVEN